MKTENMLLLGAAAVGALVLFNNNQSQAAAPAPTTAPVAPTNNGQMTSTLMPASGNQALAVLPQQQIAPVTPAPLTPAPPPGLPALPAGWDYDENGNPESNYHTQLAAGYTEVANRNHQLTDVEATQYAVNYPDLQEEIANLWKGGLTKANLQKHWTTYGQQGVSKSINYSDMPRTFMPLYPASTTPWYPAKGQLGYDGNTAWQGKSLAKSGSGLFGTILKVVTVAAGAALTVVSAGTAAPLIAAGTAAALTAENQIHGVNDLSPEEKSFIFTAAGVITHILPMYQQADNRAVNEIKNNLDIVLNYSL